jgi:hypothetical protein
MTPHCVQVAAEATAAMAHVMLPVRTRAAAQTLARLLKKRCNIHVVSTCSNQACSIRWGPARGGGQRDRSLCARVVRE